MTLETFDAIVNGSFGFLNICSFYWAGYWWAPFPYGKWFGTKTFPWLPFDEPRYDPGMNFALFTMVMEFPTLLYTFIFFPFGRHASNPKAWILMAPYVIHYFHRSLIYTSIVNRRHTKKIYIWWLVPALWITFSIATSQVRQISHHKDYDNDTWFWFRVPIGLVVFATGFRIKVWADSILPCLKDDDGEYKIPRGGWFELVSCPNYMGEIMGFLGWAIMCGTKSNLWVLFYTCALLVPRSIQTHRWYKEKFKDYPKERKALIPYVF